MGEKVVVPLGELIGWDEYVKPTAEQLRIEWDLIQGLKNIREIKKPGEETISVGPDVTVKDIEDRLIRHRIKHMRPDVTWQEIADSLGISEKKLWKKRKELYPKDHEYHPGSMPEMHTHHKTNSTNHA